MSPNVAKCLLVSKVLIADGMVTEDERAFLHEVMKRFGLSVSEQLSVVDLKGLDDAAPVVLALPLEERQALLDLLVDAASADGHLSPHELATMKRLRAALGL
ncbi:MAG TPA: TerB family tellurite resistance protein [Kofleriaceae bacterium]